MQRILESKGKDHTYLPQAQIRTGFTSRQVEMPSANVSSTFETSVAEFSFVGWKLSGCSFKNRNGTLNLKQAASKESRPDSLVVLSCWLLWSYYGYQTQGIIRMNRANIVSLTVPPGITTCFFHLPSSISLVLLSFRCLQFSPGLTVEPLLVWMPYKPVVTLQPIQMGRCYLLDIFQWLPVALRKILGLLNIGL